MTNYVLFSAVKNEGPFLLEWIAYHRAIGFDRIAIYSNDCDDGTAELLDVLDRAGIVEHRVQQVPPGSSAQGSAARLANAEGVLNPGDWAIWLDADEFLNIHAGNGHVADLVAALGSDLGLLIPWRVFGDGGNRTFPGRFVSDAFVSASAPAFKENRQVKTFFRFDDAVAGLAEVGINRPRLKAGTAGVLNRFLGGNGKPVSAESRRNRRWAAGDDFAQTCYVNPDELGWDLAQINHYTIRTPEYFALKKARGRGWAAGAVNDRHTADYYALMNRNDEEDRTILRHAEAVEQELSRLRALDGVGEAEQLVAGKSRDAIARLDPAALQAFAAQRAASRATPEVRPEADARTIIAIRTHKWDEDAVRLQAALASVPGVEVVVAFHNRPHDLHLPVPVVDINDAWVRGNGLRVLPDWGWRCGDYFLYAVRQARPGARHIWLLEPDLHFTAPPADFFSLFNGVEDDLLGVKVESVAPSHRFARGLPGIAHWRAIFALTRFSGRAADRLFALRRDYCGTAPGPRFFANDELFCFSQAMADPGLSVAGMADLAPDWLPEGAVATDPDILLDTLLGQQGPGVRHPVRSRASFVGAVADRAQNFGFFGAMRESLAALTPDERHTIAARLGAACLEAMTTVTTGKGPIRNPK